MRFVTGLCFTDIFVASESWLNNRATNLTRGRLLAVYMVAWWPYIWGRAVVTLLLVDTLAPDVSFASLMPVNRLFRVSAFGAGFVRKIGTQTMVCAR